MEIQLVISQWQWNTSEALLKIFYAYAENKKVAVWAGRHDALI